MPFIFCNFLFAIKSRGLKLTSSLWLLISLHVFLFLSDSLSICYVETIVFDFPV